MKQVLLERIASKRAQYIRMYKSHRFQGKVKSGSPPRYEQGPKLKTG